MNDAAERKAAAVVRPATHDDAAAVADLMNAFDRAYLEEPDTMNAEEIVDWWTRLEIERDTRLYFDDDGTLAGAASLHPREEGLLDLDAYVHPERTGRGLGSSMLDWLDDEAGARGHDRARTSAVATDTAAGALIASRGFEPIRHFYRMSIELHGPPPEPQWPAGFTVATFRPGEEEILHRVTESAFSEHWGFEPKALEEWRKHSLYREFWDPSLVYLVRQGDRVVAASMNAFRFGSGWVNTVATLEPWRGRGIGRALLLQAFGEFHRRGERRVALAVDAGNETGATHLYESVGMRVAWQADIYEKTLRATGRARPPRRG